MHLAKNAPHTISVLKDDSLPEEFDTAQPLSQTLNSIVDFIRFAITAFNQHDVYYGHGTQNAWEEAHRLVFTALSMPLDIPIEEQQIFYPCNITIDEKALILDWINARCEEAIPLPYLSHQAWFGGMPFYIDERALIPRSPFAELISRRFTPHLPNDVEPTLILDMCTGSGCIAIALAHQFENAQVDAVDIDSDALDVASINIEQYQLENRVFAMQSDLFSQLAEQKYDLVVVNPPYVDADDMADLPREYKHEPVSALASGDDGLDLTLALLKKAADHMSCDAWLFVEVGNSEVNFAARFKDFKVTWCDLSHGGSGIFAINRRDLVAQLPILNNL